MKKIIIQLCLISLPVLTIAQLPADSVAMIDAIMNYYKPSNPGAQLAVSRNGQIIYSAARGMANLEFNAPLNKESMIECGSVSKQFTAAAILLLEQQGKLSVEDDVRKYVPELPDYGHTIRIYHLLHHTSGLRDWGSVMDFSGWPRTSRNYTNEHALLIICRQQALNNIPGDEYIYSNSNYNMLVTIVERVSGKSLQEFTNANLFQPAGMKRTEWRADFRKVVPNRATAYAKNRSGYSTNMPNENVHGHGGLLTTAEDMLAWNNFIFTGKFGGTSLLARQLTTRPLNHGQANIYAAALVHDTVRGWKRISHNGATASYRCNLEYFPQLGLSIAWISNTSELDGGNINIADTVRNLLVKNSSVNRTAIADQQPVIKTDPGKLAAYAGWYKNNRTGNGIQVFLSPSGKELSTTRGLLLPRGENSFVQGGNTILFYTGKNKHALFVTPNNDTVYYSGVDSAIVNEKYLMEYTGIYHSNETESDYTVVMKDGKLWLEQKPTQNYRMDPTYKDGFTITSSPLFFERDKKGKITGLKISTARARNVVFTKQ